MKLVSLNKMNSAIAGEVVLLLLLLLLSQLLLVPSAVAFTINKKSLGTSMTIIKSVSNYNEQGHDYPIEDPGVAAYAQQPPHAECHFRPTHPAVATNKHKGKVHTKRFFEGWYYRITLDNNASFAFIYSIEDPFDDSELSLSCHQIMGPNDDYLVQADPDHSKFWAWDSQQALGCVMEYQTEQDAQSFSTTRTALTPSEFQKSVKSGFQMMPSRLQGKLIGSDGLGATLYQGNPGFCDYDMTVTPISGWGSSNDVQKSTAGWLASYKVFEPHWQVTLADARASGRVNWNGTIYNFANAPFYAEKNWGGSFPIKWYWCQCNSFTINNADNLPLSVTAGGGTRKLPLIRSTESLGMVSVHYNGTFYEATPWLGTMQWHISPWGYWNMSGKCTSGAIPFEVELIANCNSPGVKLRAPTEKDGMVYFCRDSFLATVTLSLWEITWNSTTSTWERSKTILKDATSTQAAVEIGGGPWWNDWKDVSDMKQPMKGLVKLPYRFANLKRKLSLRRRKKD